MEKMKYITEGGNYQRCNTCDTVIELKAKWRKSKKYAGGKTYYMLPHCPKCEKFKVYNQRHSVRKI